ncbi:antitoxin Xre/MbcA/ParS toxin-binding domain-containing protein [Xanthomonas theicola]|uniref:Uncharacterized protein n=1 Tax=Xanthomonas theicola TaxID=56464 RepID=A0A2S6ZIM8_9XANT|nr:antitoxin Xre/MbcA/ParS toxin-binding domain-containing protein [Xanthomonas theicola]PPT92095.1 hypothetical protein XthCFBP4691_05355 [Xanthomonas theicola]QNH25200.1 DUF2384 domain-containing protein [Xanthomonas theicola]
MPKPKPASNEQRIKAVLRGMRRAERNKAGRLSRTTDTLSLIGGVAYGSAADAQCVIDYLARDADTLAQLRDEQLVDIGEMICIAWNGCGGDQQALAQWLIGEHAQLGGSSPRQLLQTGASAQLLEATRAFFTG